MKLRLLSGVILTLLVLTPLSAQDKLTETPYYPLKVGTVWKYKAGDTSFAMKVTKHEKVGDQMCARIEMTMDDKLVTFKHLYVAADGIYRASFAGNRPDKPVLILKLPPKKGDTWKINTKALNEDLKGDFKVDESEVKVPAGSFKAFVATSSNLDANGLKFETTCYYAEKTGLVKQLIKVKEQETTIELTEFIPVKE